MRHHAQRHFVSGQDQLDSIMCCVVLGVVEMPQVLLCGNCCGVGLVLCGGDEEIHDSAGRRLDMATEGFYEGAEWWNTW